jgi:hypothetical protein
MMDSRGSRPNSQCSQGVKHRKLIGENLTLVMGGSTDAYVGSPLELSNLYERWLVQSGDNGHLHMVKCSELSSWIHEKVLSETM